jgi:hypothetical protein
MKHYFIGIVLLLFVSMNLTACNQSPTVRNNTEDFNNKVLSINSDEVDFNDLTSFEWDFMYAFTPYTPQNVIENVIGFQSDLIHDTVNFNY